MSDIAVQGQKKVNVRAMTVTAMLAAVAFILMFFDFSVPFMPNFIKMDLSDLPELIGTFALGPIYGVVICLLKNLLHLMKTSTAGVGELSNFILGAAFVLPAGLIYQAKKTKTRAFVGALIGVVAMGAVSVVANYFLVYPIYMKFMPKDAIIAAYQAIFPGVKSLMGCLVIFNMPFTMVKGLVSVVITMLIYKQLSPILKGHH